MTALSVAQVELIRELRYMDGWTAPAVALVVGCSAVTVRHRAPGRPGKIDNTLLRKAFEGSGKSASEVARRMGWVHKGKADVSRVRRTLGLAADIDRHGGRSFRRMIDAETAALMAEAIGVMPWEVGA